MWFAEYNYVSLLLSIVAMTFVQSISTYFNINGNFHTHLIECFIQLLIKLSHLFLFLVTLMFQPRILYSFNLLSYSSNLEDFILDFMIFKCFLLHGLINASF